MENKQKNTPGLGDKLKSNKFKHGTMATVFTLVFIALIIVLNVVVSALSDRFPSMNMDLTAQGLNTLSETAVETAEKVTKDTEICIIGSEDNIRNDRIYSRYGLKYSQVANLAEKMQEANGKIKVSFVDPDLDPTFIAQYPNEKLQAGCVVVKTDTRYKVLTVDDLFAQQTNQQDGTSKSFSKVDGALANAVHIANLENVPVIAVATGHDEMFTSADRATLDQLLKDNGFDVQEFNLLTEEIPAAAQVIMLTTPSRDYTKDEIAKLEAFLKDTSNSRSVFVTCDPSQPDLPVLDSFLEDWGIKVNEGIVVETDSARILPGYPTYLFADSVGEMFEDNTYENLMIPQSASIETLFKSNNNITTYPLLETGETAYVTSGDTLEENPVTSKQVLATCSQRMETIDNKVVRSNVIVMGSTMPFIGQFISTSTFSDRQFVTDLMKYGTGTVDAAQSLYVESTETNALDISASAATINFVGLILFTIAVPAAILIAGLVIFLRRRHL